MIEPATAPELAPAPATPSPPGPGRGPNRDGHRRGDHRRAWDLLAPVAYLAVAVGYYAHIWADPNHRISKFNPGDSALFEWMLAHAARSLTHLENPLFSTRINTPFGLNLMANTSALGIGLPFAPITLIFGAAVSFILALTLAMAATATAWYFFFSRCLVTSRAAAFVGAGLAAFAPGMLSHGEAHLNIIFQVVLTAICWRVCLLVRTQRPVRDGVILGALVVLQCLIGEEPLALTAIALAIIAVWYAIARPAQARMLARPVLTVLGVAALVAGVVLAYPLLLQFRGSGSYTSIPDIPAAFGADLASYPRYSGLTLGGDPQTLFNIYASPAYRPRLITNVAEINTFLGLPLLVLLVVAAIWLWRSFAVRLTAAVLAASIVFSLGIRLVVWDHTTHIWLPWALLAKLPLLHEVVPSRFALVADVAAGALVALLLDRVRTTQRFPALHPWTRWAVFGLTAVALVPLIPRPMPAVTPTPEPAFLSSGAWQRYVKGDRSILVIPPDKNDSVEAMRWSAASGLAYRSTDGYFIVRDSRYSDGRGGYTSPLTPTERLLTRATVSDVVVSPADVRRARPDLRSRDVGVVLLPATAPAVVRVLTTAERLLGPATSVGGGWIWVISRT